MHLGARQEVYVYIAKQIHGKDNCMEYAEFVLYLYLYTFHLAKSNSLRPCDMYKCISRLTIIGSNNDLSPDRHQAIIWTNAGILIIGPLETHFSEILIKIHIY